MSTYLVTIRTKTKFPYPMRFAGEGPPSKTRIATDLRLAFSGIGETPVKLVPRVSRAVFAELSKQVEAGEYVCTKF